jgi:hypothetical protein
MNEGVLMRARHLTALGAGVAGLAMVAAPALASAPYTVSVGGDTSGASYTMNATAKGNTTLTANGNVLTCTASTLTASTSVSGGGIHTGVNSTGLDIADITGATWTGCTFSGSFPATVTVTSPDWKFNVTGGNTSGTSDTITGNLTNISNVLVDINTGFGHCTFNVSGSVDGNFQESTTKGAQQLNVTNSHLSLSNVSAACFGLVNNGDAATFSGQYNTAVPGVAYPAINIS